MPMTAWVCAVSLCLLAVGPAAAREAPPAIFPVPASVTAGQGTWTLPVVLPIAVPRGDRGAAAAATLLADLMRRSAIATRSDAPSVVRFRRTTGGASEGYRLVVDASGATISATTDAGLRYGAVTLWQLASAARVENGRRRLAAVTIDDAPRFAWRGLMLDSARHYQSPAFIRQLLDVMVASKLNTFHWHLVDDQGWRLPIPKYPRLTEVGGFRRPATAPDAPPLPVTGGIYTADEIRGIVAYAAARGIVVVPEIEMPGHALSAIRAYPRLGTGAVPSLGIESDWGVFPYLYNVEEPTFAFLKDVLDETLHLFPSTYIHIGGDEAVKDQWRASPAVQARMRALGIKDEEALQSWFVDRLGRYLTEHGRRMIGWDEILDGGIPPTATIMSWRGIDGAVAAARAGHDAVVAASPTLYLDHRRSDGDPLPGRNAVFGLRDVYAFDPAPVSLSAGEQRHILGLQANMWTEHARTEERVAAKMFPRGLAVADLGWAAAGARDYDRFLRRLGPQIARLKVIGIDASIDEPLVVRMPDERSSFALDRCGAPGAELALEDDYPAAGPRAVFLIDILRPCWRFPAARLDGVTGIRVVVGQIPFNFQIGKDREMVRFRPLATPAGEFEVRRDACDGPLVATLPLAPAAANPTTTTLRAPLAGSGTHDLCITYTAKGVDPLWAIDRVALERAR